MFRHHGDVSPPNRVSPARWRDCNVGARPSNTNILLHALHVPFTCSACSKVMFNMYLLHVQYVQSTCSTCTFYMFSMFKGHVLHVPFACSVCHFTFTLRTSVSHNSLKSSPISMILIYMCSLHLGLKSCTICEKF